MRQGAWQATGKAFWLVPALLGVPAGTAVQTAQAALLPAPALTAVLLGGLGLSGFVLWAGKHGRWRWAAMLLAVAAIVFAQIGWRALAFQAQALSPALEGRDLQLTGIVTAMAQVTDAGLRFPMQVEQALLDGTAVRLPPRIQLGWYGDGFRQNGDDDAAGASTRPPAVVAGERWRMVVRLKAPHGNLNPLGFDYELWMWSNDLQAVGYVRGVPTDGTALRLGQTWRHPVEWARQQVRDRIMARLGQERQAGWIAALVTGDQNAIERADWDIFRATGVAHLMAISGLHVTMFAWLAGAVAAALWRRSARCCLVVPAPHAALLAGLLLATLYAVFSGWGVPSQRTIWMLAWVGLLRLSGRRWPWPLVWLTAADLVLLIDPWALMQAGFWLSFVAVGVLFASGAPAGRSAPIGLRARGLAMLREQSVITLALSPLVLLLFGQVSLVGLVANLLAIPWVTLIVTPLALAGVLWAPLWELAAWAVSVLAVWLQWLAQLRFATLTLAIAPLWLGAAAVVGGVVLVLRLPLALRLAGAALLLPALLWQEPPPAHGQFALLLADIGQGNAVVVRTAGHVLLYDAGPRYSRDTDAGQRVLVPLLRALDLRLDMLVLSHRDTDHVGGAGAVLAMLPEVPLLSSLAADHALNPPGRGQRCVAGQHWRWDGVDFEVLHPRAADYVGVVKPNTVSCVLRISAPGMAGQSATTALLTGDIEAAQEARLVADSAPKLAADLLLVPHHGSKTSSTGVFLDAVAPRIAVVQSGYRNRFGHPAAEPMGRYRQRGISVFDAPHCGAMWWGSDRPMVVVCERTAQRRYWHHITPP
ncbi:MAG: DNA internalization-related competence protein ComEC/Rec2 [Burkholderiaceae bacterium]